MQTQDKMLIKRESKYTIIFQEVPKTMDGLVNGESATQRCKGNTVIRVCNIDELKKQFGKIFCLHGYI